MTVIFHTFIRLDGGGVFAVCDVPETSSNYRLLVQPVEYGSPDGPTGWVERSVIIALLNWGTSGEWGHIPTDPGSSYSLAEHLTGGNVTDGENLVEICRQIAEEIADAPVLP